MWNEDGENAAFLLNKSLKEKLTELIAAPSSYTLTN